MEIYCTLAAHFRPAVFKRYLCDSRPDATHPSHSDVITNTAEGTSSSLRCKNVHLEYEGDAVFMVSDQLVVATQTNSEVFFLLFFAAPDALTDDRKAMAMPLCETLV